MTQQHFSSLKSQAGMTFIGWVMTLVVIGFFALFAMRLVPVFLEYQAVTSVMSQLETMSPQTSAIEMRQTLGRSLSINEVDSVERQDFEFKKTSDGTVVSIKYDARTNFIGNIDLLITFENSVTVGNGS